MWSIRFCRQGEVSLVSLVASRCTVINADLHCHSRQSDGVFTPEELAMRAKSNGVDLWALTDHDDVSGIASARSAAKQHDLTFVSGVEISVTFAAQTVHVVGLGIDETHPVLLAGLEQLCRERDARALLIADKLAQAGFDGTYEGALTHVQNPALVSRTHFARHLYETGHVSSMQDAFDRYLGDQGRAYVPTQWATLEEAVYWIMQSGGIAVIAHPGRYKYTDLQFDTLFKQFLAFGGQGIEVHTGSHRPDEYDYYAQVARDYGFVASIGSDFHGPTESRHDLGSIRPLPRDLTPVWQALGVAQ